MEEKKYAVSQDTMLVSLVEGLSSVIFSESKKDKEIHILNLGFRLKMLMPKSLEEEKDKYICMIIQLVASYVGLAELELEAMQKQVHIGFNEAYRLDASSYGHTEEGLQSFCTTIIFPVFLTLGIDLKLEFMELDALRTELRLDERI